MVPIIVAVLVIGFIFIMVKRNKVSITPEYLRGKHVSKHIDEITGRSVYLSSYKDAYGNGYVVEAFYADDNSACLKALVRQAYGFMLYEDGKLSVVRRSFAMDLINKFVKKREENKKLKRSKDLDNYNEEIENDGEKGDTAI